MLQTASAGSPGQLEKRSRKPTPSAGVEDGSKVLEEPIGKHLGRHSGLWVANIGAQDAVAGLGASQQRREPRMNAAERMDVE